MITTLCGSHCWTDHRPAVSKFHRRIQPARRPQGKKVPMRINVSKLKQDRQRREFISDICSLSSDDQKKKKKEKKKETWTVFRDTVQSAAINSLGAVSCKYLDWFDKTDEEIQGLLEENTTPHKKETYLSDTSSVSSKATYSNTCKTIQFMLKDMHDFQLRNRADEIQTESIRSYSLMH